MKRIVVVVAVDMVMRVVKLPQKNNLVNVQSYTINLDSILRREWASEAH